jgi:hypothetical protein
MIGIIQGPALSGFFGNSLFVRRRREIPHCFPPWVMIPPELQTTRSNHIDLANFLRVVALPRLPLKGSVCMPRVMDQI